MKGRKPFEIGSISTQEKEDQVTGADYIPRTITTMSLSDKDEPTFIARSKIMAWNINMNGIYDVYDYTFAMYKLDGGTKEDDVATGKTLVPNIRKFESRRYILRQCNYR